MSIARSLTLSLCAALLIACGYSDEEMRKKNAEINDLRSALTAEQASGKKARDELENARKTVDDLKGDLKARGVDISKVNASVEQQARALEEYKRHLDQLEAVKHRYELLRQKLANFKGAGLVVTVRTNRMVVQIPGDALFESGKDTLKKEGEAMLSKIAEIVRNDPGLSSRTFQIATHTDTEPARGSFKDNWALTLMRSREVLLYLAAPVGKGGGLNPTHWSAAGFADTDPIGSNDTAEGKKKNRRCEIVIIPNPDELLELRSLPQ